MGKTIWRGEDPREESQKKRGSKIDTTADRPNSTPIKQKFPGTSGGEGELFKKICREGVYIEVTTSSRVIRKGKDRDIDLSKKGLPVARKDKRITKAKIVKNEKSKRLILE